MTKKPYSFRVNSEEYPDLVRWLDSLEGKRSETIREILQTHIEGGRVTLGDVYQAVKDLERKVKAGTIVTQAPGDDAMDWNEPPEAAAALDALTNL